jgi:ATP-dependent DNA helicase PIF1
MGLESVEKLIENISLRKPSRERWQKTRVLIIDESKYMVSGGLTRKCADMCVVLRCLIVSMVDATLFDKLETIARRFGASDKPFGGIQVKYLLQD